MRTIETKFSEVSFYKKRIELTHGNLLQNTFARHTSSLYSELLPWQLNLKKLLAVFASKESAILNNSVTYKDIQLKFGKETNFQ